MGEINMPEIKGIKTKVGVLTRQLRSAVNEKDIEGAWRGFLSEYYNDRRNGYVDPDFSSPYNTDGYVTTGGFMTHLRLLMEFKHGTDLSQTSDRVRILTQMIHYMKMFKDDGEPLPNILLGADADSAFIVYAPNFYHYLDEPYNWGVAPSKAYLEDINLYRALQEDSNTQAFIYTFNQGSEENHSNMQGLLKEIIAFMTGHTEGEYKIEITEQNILKLFGEFSSRGFSHYQLTDIDPVEEMSIFMNMLVSGDNINYYQHPNDPNILVANGEQYNVDGAFLNMFIKRYNRKLDRNSIDKLNAIADRLIEDSARRDTGDFWTPEVWANRSHEIMDEVIGSDWRETSLVWDSAAGAKNLTRSKHFNQLYTSTLHEGEVLLGAPYNPEAIETFQYDFLNDDVRLDPNIHSNPSEWKMPDQLFNDLKRASETGQRVIFYTNPPYARGRGVSSSSLMNKWMTTKGYGNSKAELYIQFIGRVMKLINEFKLTNVYIAYFTKTNHYTGASFKNFNDLFFSDFEMVTGNVFSVEEFSGTSGNFGVTFSLYKYSPGTNRDLTKLQHNLSVEQYNKDTKQIDVIGSKLYETVYNDELLRPWVREEERVYEKMEDEIPLHTDAFTTGGGKESTETMYEGSIGSMFFNGNRISHNSKYVCVYSVKAKRRPCFDVVEDNFDRSVVAYAARRVITNHWLTHTENYKKPNTTKEGYDEFVNDSLVYTLFDTKSYQASYRNYERYTNCNRPGRWVNQWFWMDIETVRRYADELNVRFIYDDTRGDTNRYVAQQIQQRSFSPEAQRVLDLATELWVDTLKGRDTNRVGLHENHLTAWDAGFYQLKQLVKYYPSTKMDELNEAIKVLSNKIEEGVYHFEMLVK